MIQLTIPGKPLGKQRHQTAIRQMADGRAFTHEYTPEQTVNYETYTKLLFAEKYPDHIPYPKGSVLLVNFRMFVPHSKESLKHDWLFTTMKPDEDNTKKIVYDALNNLAYADDCQVATGQYFKIYGQRPRVEIDIFPIMRDWERDILSLIQRQMQEMAFLLVGTRDLDI